MDHSTCPHCGKSLEALQGAAFCPFCGGQVLSPQENTQDEPAAVQDLLATLERMNDPKAKHELLLQAEKDYPQSLSVARELLHLGRLYERGGKNADFSIIKCYLLMLYLDPGSLRAQQKDALREELFAHPQLQKCLALTDDPDAFMRKYLLQLSGEFIHLFLRGDSRYMRRIFGLTLDSRAAKLLADPAAIMLRNMQADSQLTPEQRSLLTQTFYQAFSKDMAGETRWLDEALKKAEINIPGIG